MCCYFSTEATNEVMEGIRLQSSGKAGTDSSVTLVNLARALENKMLRFE